MDVNLINQTFSKKDSLELVNLFFRNIKDLDNLRYLRKLESFEEVKEVEVYDNFNSQKQNILNFIGDNNSNSINLKINIEID